MKKRKSKPTPGNTAFVSVAAWPNADRQTSVFRRSAIRCGIEVHFVDYGATWGGFYRHKILHLRGKLHELLERDMEYVICTDSRDVVFVDSAEAIIERFARLDQGGVLFGADKPRAVFPFTRPWFRQAVLEHCRHENEIVNTGTYAGTIEAVLDLFEHCDRLRTLACELDGQPKNNRAPCSRKHSECIFT